MPKDMAMPWDVTMPRDIAMPLEVTMPQNTISSLSGHRRLPGAGPRAQLPDHAALRQEGPQPGGHRRRPRRHQGTPGSKPHPSRVTGGCADPWVGSDHPLCPPLQSQGALAGRLRSFSMQDLRSLREQDPVHFQDPLYLEGQENLQQPLGEELWGGLCLQKKPQWPCWELARPLCPQGTVLAVDTRVTRMRRSCGRTRRCPPHRPHAGTPNPCPAARA